MLQNPDNFPVHQVPVAKIDHVLQKSIRLFHFIPEREIILRKLERFQVMLFNDSRPERIKCRKNPASPAALLISNALNLDLITEEFVVIAYDLAIEK